MATCVSFYNAVGNLDAYSMFYSFYLGIVIGFVSNQLPGYHIGKSWRFLKSHILNKSFRQSSNQFLVVTKIISSKSYSFVATTSLMAL